MPRVQIPRSCPFRRALTYARLLVRVYPDRRLATAFEGRLFKPGARIDEAELWPNDEYPATPLLLEYAGHDHTGHGHRRSNDVYLLWRYDRANGWVELIRASGQGADWIEYLKPVALRELASGAPPVDAAQQADAARGISGRVLGMLDLELERLGASDRHLVMSFVHQAFCARAVAY